jgi:hypothetical protein
MEPSITIKLEDLLEALKKLRKLEPGTRLPWILLSQEEGDLRIAYVSAPKSGGYEYGTSIRISAEGNWPGRAGLPRTVLNKFLKVMPDEDTLTFVIRDGKLRMGPMALSCRWEEDPPPNTRLVTP